MFHKSVHLHYIFKHLADAFIQSDLLISGYTFFFSMCSLGIEPTTFALLTQCSTTEPQSVHSLYTLLIKEWHLAIRQHILLIRAPDTRPVSSATIITDAQRLKQHGSSRLKQDQVESGAPSCPQNLIYIHLLFH